MNSLFIPSWCQLHTVGMLVTKCAHPVWKCFHVTKLTSVLVSGWRHTHTQRDKPKYNYMLSAVYTCTGAHFQVPVTFAMYVWVCEHDVSARTLLSASTVSLSSLLYSISETMAESVCAGAGERADHLSKRELPAQPSMQIYGLFPLGWKVRQPRSNFSRQRVCETNVFSV